MSFEYGNDPVSQAAKAAVIKEATRAVRVAELRAHIAKHHYAESTVGFSESLLEAVHASSAKQGSHPEE